LRGLLRNPNLSKTELYDQISKLFVKTVLEKPPGHGINNPDFVQPIRPMSAIGG